MWDEEENFAAPNGQNGQQAPMEPQIDPYELEKIRQEVELAHEEFQRLLNGRRRLYSQFR